LEENDHGCSGMQPLEGVQPGMDDGCSTMLCCVMRSMALRVTDPRFRTGSAASRECGGKGVAWNVTGFVLGRGRTDRIESACTGLCLTGRGRFCVSGNIVSDASAKSSELYGTYVATCLTIKTASQPRSVVQVLLRRLCMGKHD
jgi:hypothetical protein